MKAGRVSGMAAAAVMVLGFGAAAWAATAEEAIKARQACMKANGAAMGVMVPMVKGEKPYDNAAVQAALDGAAAACGGWADWWGDDTMPGGATKTRAKAEIWTDKAGFEAAGAAYGQAFGGVKASTDEASFKAAFGPLGASCQGCHEKFQAPEN